MRSMIEWLKQRRKAVWAFVSFLVTDATVINTLHPNAKVTAVLTVLSLLGVGAVHQATNASTTPQV